MTSTPYTRADLIEYGVLPEHTHVCEWVADNGQSDMVVGLGRSEQEALDRAIESEARREIDTSGGELVVYEISD